MIYDFAIVGSGLTGAICARELTNKGYKCLIFEKRNHIGGNCYSELIDGIHTSKYGAHFFRTSSERILTYFNKYGILIPYYHRSKALHNNKVYSFPINLMTMHQLWNEIITPADAKKKIEEVRWKIDKPDNFEDMALSLVGEEIYQAFFYGYTKKQWQVEPRLLPAYIIKRLPLRFSYDDRYVSSLYQGVPKDGWDTFFEKLLDGIEIKLNTPFEKNIKAGKIIYTGGIDSFYDYIYGKLEYNGVRYEYSDEDIGTAIMNYSDYEIPYTRKISYGYFYQNKEHDNFVTATEYFSKDFEPAYPMVTKENLELYQKYKDIKTDVIFAGRLGCFLYLDMDAAMERALKLVEKL